MPEGHISTASGVAKDYHMQWDISEKYELKTWEIIVHEWIKTRQTLTKLSDLS